MPAKRRPPCALVKTTPTTTSASALITAGAATDLRDPVAQYLATLQSPNSRRMMLCGLRTCLDLWFKGRPHAPAETFPWWTARFEHTNMIRAALAAEYISPATANLYLAALRGVMLMCWKLRHITWEEYGAAGSPQALPTIKGTAAHVDTGRCLTNDEQAALFTACAADPTPAGRRDAAVLSVLLYGGLRRAEAAALHVEDVDGQRMMITVRRGKGRKARTVPLLPRTAALVTAWMQAARRPAGPLFTTVLRGGQAGRRPLTGRPIAALLAKRAAAAGVVDVTPHDTRRTFATNLYEAKVSLEEIRDLLGHASVEMTRRYLRLHEAAARAALDTLEAFRHGAHQRNDEGDDD